MASREPKSPKVTVYMTEEEALWAEMERADSQQGSSFERALFSEVLSARALSQVGVGPSGRQVRDEEFDSEEIEVLYSEPETVKLELTQGNISIEPVVEESRLGEGILLKNSRSKVTNDELKNVEILVQNTTKYGDPSPKGLRENRLGHTRLGSPL